MLLERIADLLVRCAGFMSRLAVTDDSLQAASITGRFTADLQEIIGGFPLVMFSATLDRLPVVRSAGDVLLLKNVKVGTPPCML